MLWTPPLLLSCPLSGSLSLDLTTPISLHPPPPTSHVPHVQILLRHGGLYVDVDFLCFGSFDDLHKRYEFYAGVSNTGTFELNNGLIG